VKNAWLLVPALVAAGLWLGVRQLTVRAAADITVIPAATVVALPAYAEGSGSYSYVGSTACKKCHIKEHKSWAASKMGKAFETLKPGQAQEIRERFHVDVNKDYTRDPACLKCHTTGYGKPGGYVLPPEGDAKAAREAAKMEGVGCESCHGPASEYIKVFEEITKSKRKYKLEELTKVGLIVLDETTCKGCHNTESPTHDASKPFEFAHMVEEGVHERVPLKDRED